MHAIRIGRRIAEFDIGWYEEPCLCDNIELVAEVRRALPGVPIVTGEAIYSKEAFAQALAARAADIINPDICNCGGISRHAGHRRDGAAARGGDGAAQLQFDAGRAGGDGAAFGDDPEFLDRRVLHQPEAGLRRDRGRRRWWCRTASSSCPPRRGIGIDLDVAKLRARPYRDMGTRMGKGLRSYTEEFPRKHYVVAATRTGY